MDMWAPSNGIAILLGQEPYPYDAFCDLNEILDRWGGARGTKRRAVDRSGLRPIASSRTAQVVRCRLTGDSTSLGISGGAGVLVALVLVARAAPVAVIRPCTLVIGAGPIPLVRRSISVPNVVPGVHATLLMARGGRSLVVRIAVRCVRLRPKV